MSTPNAKAPTDSEFEDELDDEHAGDAQVEPVKAAEHPSDPQRDKLTKRIAELEARVAELQEQTRHYAQMYDKARVEFTAAQGRIQRENERNAKREQVKMVGGLLGVLDTLDRSLDSVKSGQIGPAFVEGVQIIRQQFDAALTGLGLQRFDGIGEAFDPARHQAVTSMPVLDEALHDHVVQSLAAGVVVGDEIVRVASVIVGRYNPGAATVN